MKKKILSAYKKLLSEFGTSTACAERKQGRHLCELRLGRLASTGKTLESWWPADSDYEVVVGAILTQNTNWKNVEKAIANLRKAKKLSERSIMKIPIAELEQLIRPSGFYRQKAERLKLATKKWLQLKGKKLGVYELRTELLSVKGIGKETADSIVLYAFHKPIFVIDAYTRRFCKEFFDFEAKNYDDYQKFFEKNLPRDVALFKEYHALIVEWAKGLARK